MEISSRIEKAVYILILPFLILSLSGCYFFPQEEEVLAPPLKAPEKVTYRTIKVEKGNIEKRVNATAYFVSDNQTDLSFKHRGGRIESINVKTGDMVEAGDTLIQLETDNLETQLLQQEIALEKLILNYNQSLSNAERSIKLANFELEELEKKLEKLKNTIENIPKEVSVQDVMPDAIDNLELLEERIKRQELEVEGEIVKYNNIKDMMELDIKTAEIQIENLQTELEKTKLVSPVTGRVVWITSSKVGEYIYAHSNLIRIADVTRLKLRYTGDSISDFKMGDKVEVKIDNDEYVGIVVMTPSTAPFDADDSIKKSVLIDVKGLPAEVKLGDAARISLLLDRRDDVIVIPRDLLHGFMGQKTVYILDDGIKKDRNVQVGIETPTEVEIVKGLEEGEEIIEN
ncbi:MAG TPA: biotin/lipoyl-binding protein [Clostridiaceae bacterium]|nr:biotin/lipoyl-binding protein [Clostridiaceae bacterium]